MDLVTALGRIVPFAFASGVNLYATIAVVGLCSRFHLISLPDQFRGIESVADLHPRRLHADFACDPSRPRGLGRSPQLEVGADERRPAS